MSKYDKHIRTGGDPILKLVCDSVLPGDDLAFVDLLVKVARKCKRAVGLAAPQIGYTKRVIFILAPDQSGTVRGRTMFNPKIVSHSGLSIVEREACLSYPGMSKKIARPQWILVEYQSILSIRRSGRNSRITRLA